MLEFTDCSNKLVACHLSSFTNELEQDACSFWNGVVRTLVSQRNAHQADVLSILSMHMEHLACSKATDQLTVILATLATPESANPCSWSCPRKLTQSTQ